MNNKKEHVKIKVFFITLILVVIFCGCIIKQNIGAKKQYVHFSIDDTIGLFEDLTQNKYKTIFENETLRFLKECNKLYGTQFSLYCFYENNDFCLNDCTDRYVEEFEQNSEWLKFGFHGLNSSRDYSILTTEETREDYELVIKHLKRIVGEKSITTVIRIEKFLCNKQNAEILANVEFGITGLLGADTIDRQNYYLNESVKKQVVEEEFYVDKEIGIVIYNTDMRIENINNVYQEFNKVKDDKIIILFTHEWALNNTNKDKIKKISNIMNKDRVKYDFL